VTTTKAVLFDFGGVLIDGPFEAFARYERDNGLPPGFIRELNANNHQDNAWARYERSEITFSEFCDAFECEALAGGGRIDTRALFALLSGSLREEMVEALRRCTRYFKTGLLTNNFIGSETRASSSRPQYEEVLALFDVVVESSVTGIRKPDPRFYQLACRQLDIEPDEAVFLDDLGVNLKPARELGMVTIKVDSTARALDELEQLLGIPLR
jgi:putative hydrolase of the HAD superfamily